jgi:ABC-2 type transport system ATP-binding protein
LPTEGSVEHATTVLGGLLGEDEPVTPSPAEATVRFETTRDDGQLSETLSGLIAGGVAVSQFRELQSDLEDAFLSVLRRDQTEPAAAAG